MTGLLTTALTGFFILSAAGGVLSDTIIPDAKEQSAKSAIVVRSGSRKILSDTPKAAAIATYTVAMTGYNAVPEQTDSDPFTTASGADSNPEVMAARSVDLAEELPFGTVIEITRVNPKDRGCAYELTEPHVGLRVIGDSMHPRKRNQIDLLFDADILIDAGNRKLNPAFALGYCKDVDISVVGFVPIKDIPETQTELKALIGKKLLTVNK